MRRLSFIVVLISIAISAFSQKFPEHYYRAQAAVQANHLDLALQWIDSATIASPRLPNIWIKKGEIFYLKSMPDSALAYFTKAETIRNGVAAYWMARCHSLLGDTTSALAELERHLSSTPKEFEATILLDTAFTPIKGTRQWQDLWLNHWYNNNELLAADVAYHFSRGEWDYALDLLNERMHGRNVRHSFYALRGEAYYSIGSYKAAEADFAQALKRSRRNHSYMAWRGKSLAQLNKHRKAIRLLNQAIELSGGEPEYIKARAMAFASSQEYDKAFADIKEYLTFYPTDTEALAINLDISLKANRNIDALLTVNRLLKLQPDKWQHYLTRGSIYIKSKNWEVAEIDLNRAIELGADSKEAFLWRGNCRFNLGNRSGACADWKQAVKRGSFQSQELVYKHCP
ncbi:MAG: tetratricopeptide repeat protein [Tenuifilaceae bacterium]|jgi:tetratricopeptide (TPR) repeat protein|nr:tetratricopeptide repeat protein [Tenuifilaceae bacterium]